MLNFQVRYRLDEYLQVLEDFVPEAKRRNAVAAGKPLPATAPLGWFERGLVRVFGSVAFLVKSYRVGASDFSIDAEGVSRASKTGTLRVAWCDVLQVHKLSAAYLVEKANGAMPIPFRVLSAEQRRALEALAGQKLSVSHSANAPLP